MNSHHLTSCSCHMIAVLSGRKEYEDRGWKIEDGERAEAHCLAPSSILHLPSSSSLAYFPPFFAPFPPITSSTVVVNVFIMLPLTLGSCRAPCKMSLMNGIRHALGLSVTNVILTRLLLKSSHPLPLISMLLARSSICSKLTFCPSTL